MKKVSVRVKCPFCKACLMDSNTLINNKDTVHLNIKVQDGTKGNIYLSSIYGDFNFTSDIKIPDDEIVNFFCPYCGKNLKRKKVECDQCGAPIISLECTVGGRISFCSRMGCKNHYVVFENLDKSIERFYKEYGFH